MKVAMRRGLRTLRKMIISGRDRAITDIMNAKTVPRAAPFSSRACTTGIMPAALEYMGIPINTDAGTAIVHLGMTGSVFIVDRDAPAGVHDHFDIELDSGKALRFRDPRRFGSFLWSREPLRHPLLAKLGPEPLGEDFSGDYLWTTSRGRKVSIKQFIMNAQIVVGVGNIYASESLFLAGINPRRAAGRVARHRYELLATAIRDVLSRSIKAGGTTLRDFYGGDGEPGYFRQQLEVYDREGEHCRQCNTLITAIVQGQRSTYYCKSCQT